MEQTLYMYTRVCVKEFMRAPKITEEALVLSEQARQPTDAALAGGTRH
jgi:hypothetical protein